MAARFPEGLEPSFPVFAALYQFGVAPYYLEGGLLFLAPKTDGHFVLSYTDVIHG